MEWLKDLEGKTVGIDTSPLIYFIEEHPIYLDTLKGFFKAMDEGVFVVVTSTVTLLEVLIHPLRNNKSDLAMEYRDILLHSILNTKELSGVIAEQAARLRADHNLRTPDAIQLATAMHAGASCFLTNDIRLPKIPAIKMLILDEIVKEADLPKA